VNGRPVAPVRRLARVGTPRLASAAHPAPSATRQAPGWTTAGRPAGQSTTPLPPVAPAILTPRPQPSLQRACTGGVDNSVRSPAGRLGARVECHAAVTTMSAPARKTCRLRKLGCGCGHLRCRHLRVVAARCGWGCACAGAYLAAFSVVQVWSIGLHARTPSTTRPGALLVFGGMRDGCTQYLESIYTWTGMKAPD
jgi:hypothetical protein